MQTLQIMRQLQSLDKLEPAKLSICKFCTLALLSGQPIVYYVILAHVNSYLKLPRGITELIITSLKGYGAGMTGLRDSMRRLKFRRQISIIFTKKTKSDLSSQLSYYFRPEHNKGK